VTVLPIAQTASLVGVYGLSMILALTSGTIAYALVVQKRRFLPLVGTVVVVIALAFWGTWRIRDGALTREGTPIRVGVVQGNISQEEKWDASLRDPIMKRYVDLSRVALSDGAQFILWPESSLPFYFELDPPGVAPIRRLAREGHAAFLIGSDQVEQVQLVSDQPAAGERERYYNAAFLVQPDGLTGGVYRKMHLVPFGEYVPLKQVLFFVGPLVEAVSDFSAGDTPALFRVAGHTASTAICYEVVYPRLIAGFVGGGSELLTTITNDAWFGTSSAAYQHWDQAAMRSIEQGRYLARAANTGISGFVDPYGRVLSRTKLFEPAAQVREVRFLTERTIYGHIGDSVAYAGLAIAILTLAASTRRSRTGPQNPEPPSEPTVRTR
jgi:apolipoprotein N-acyltransferase